MLCDCIHQTSSRPFLQFLEPVCCCHLEPKYNEYEISYSLVKPKTLQVQQNEHHDNYGNNNDIDSGWDDDKYEDEDEDEDDEGEKEDADEEEDEQEEDADEDEEEAEEEDDVDEEEEKEEDNQ